ncbi:MAG: hypothetical protein K5905_11960 [Roseibium sp.]|uniref:hypothetical protein n=1 Tax=Roseibium sp. TaxID=1936156 RepID=UPI002628CF92|nr:hypothetical protein [Roseibium sp.]MCV0426181.1 hypothetical protein [Roseibium sp.]
MRNEPFTSPLLGKHGLALRDLNSGQKGVRLVSKSRIATSTQGRHGLFDASRATDLISLVCAALSVLLWLISLPQMDPDQLNNFGLVSILPASFWAGICFATLGFVLSLDASCRWPALRPAFVILLILLLHATPPVVYETLRYSWAWKHIGIVDYIQRHGEVDREAPFLAAYHNWPFFFWSSAKVAGFLGLDALQIANLARFFPILSNLCYAALLVVIFRRFTEDFRLVWAGVWMFLCANWVGQDYYSPQAFAYGLYLMVLAICLGPLMPVRRKEPAHSGIRLKEFRSLLSRGHPRQPVVSQTIRIVLVVAACVAIWIMVASHQLTPLVLIVSLVALSLLCGLSLGFAALAALAVVSWVIYPAAPFTAVVLPEEVAGMMRTFNGITEKFIDTSSVDPEVAIVAWAGRFLTLGIALLAGCGWLRRIWHGGRDGVASALAAAPLSILIVTSYGGEAVFRIFLFCVPFLSFFAAALFFPTNTSGRGSGVRLLFGTLTLLMIVGFYFGNNGKDRQYRFSPEEVIASNWLYERAPAGTLLVEGARNYPSQFRNYENFTYVPIAREGPEARGEILADPANVLSRWFGNERWNDGFVIITRSQKAHVEALGIMPKGALDMIEMELLASPEFQLVFANRDARIFTASRFLQAGPSN